MAGPEQSESGREKAPELSLEQRREAIKEQSRRERGDLTKDIWSQFGEMGEQLKEVFMKLGDEVKSFLQKNFGIKFDKTGAAGGPEKPVNLPKNLAGDLKKVLTENPDWLLYAQEASQQYGVPVAGLFAIMKNESNFDPNISSTVASGLGQFVNSTWQEFQGENESFTGMSRNDPRASIFATAWYCRKLANSCGIDLKAPDAFAKIWQAYHEGPEGYQRLQNYLKGQGELVIPSTYIEKYKTAEEYAAFLNQNSKKIQGTFEQYKGSFA